MKVLLLRPREQSAELSFLLEEEGHTALHLPLLDYALPAARGLQAAAEHLARFRWVLPDSPHAVRAFLEAAYAAGTLRAASALQWISLDPATARAVERHGFVSRVVDGSTVGGLVGAGDDVLVLHEAGAAPAWLEQVHDTGAQVTTSLAWQSRPAPSLDGFAADAIVVHSPSAAEALLELLPPESAARLIAAGPATAGALTSLGAKVWAVAARPAADAVLDATLAALSG